MKKKRRAHYGTVKATTDRFAHFPSKKGEA